MSHFTYLISFQFCSDNFVSFAVRLQHVLWFVAFLYKKSPPLWKISFSGTRAFASCYHPKFTYISRYKPYQLRTRNDSSIVYHYNGWTRRSLGITASVRSSETIFSSSFCACSHLTRLSVTYLTTYSSLHSLWYIFCYDTAN